jgi:hypothetical protein
MVAEDFKLWSILCEEDFLLELGWVLMITNSHHKRRKLMEAQDEKTR